MKTLKFQEKSEWLEARKGKFTGTVPIVPRRGNKPKMGFYEVLAERLVVPDDTEDGMERGLALEEEALDRFEKETGKELERGYVLWVSDDNPNIAVSPDAPVKGEKAAVETKCLSSHLHLKAYVEQDMKNDFYDQAIQYFVVNEKLKTLYFAFYDPRIPAKEFFYLTIARKDVQEDIEKYRKFEQECLERIDEIINELTF